MTAAPLGFIFDLDGTIIDSTSDYREVWSQLIQEFGTGYDPDVLMGHSARDGLRLMLGKDYPEAEITAIVERQAEMGLVRMQASGVKPHTGIRELIMGLHTRGVRLALATLAERKNAEWCLQQIRVKDFFHVIVSDNDVTRSKPHPDVYLAAIKNLGVTASNCAAIEDSPNGVRAAKSAGLRCIAVLNTHTREQLTEADWIIESAASLMPEEVVGFIRHGERRAREDEPH